jgi:hypothetical protein
MRSRVTRLSEAEEIHALVYHVVSRFVTSAADNPMAGISEWTALASSLVAYDFRVSGNCSWPKGSVPLESRRLDEHRDNIHFQEGAVNFAGGVGDFRH